MQDVSVNLWAIQSGTLLSTGCTGQGVLCQGCTTPYTGSVPNDIVVDVVDQIGYISSTGNNVTGLGGAIMYDQLAKTIQLLSTHLHMQWIELSTSTSP